MPVTPQKAMPGKKSERNRTTIGRKQIGVCSVYLTVTPWRIEGTASEKDCMFQFWHRLMIKKLCEAQSKTE
jgi:asparagine synthetase B (glutamine-hydrolysing)